MTVSDDVRLQPARLAVLSDAPPSTESDLKHFQPARGVTCRNLSREYVNGDLRVKALRGVNLSIRPGELTLLMGPSGCGKTTLLSIIAGTLDPCAGNVSVFDTELGSLSASEKAEFRARNVGFVFQHLNLLPRLTALENVAVPLLIQRHSTEVALKRARQTLSEVGVGDRVDSLPGQLSGGQQQRVAIARALVHRPRLLVCDEPTSAVDALTGRAVMSLIRQIALQPDRVTIVVTHDQRVLGFADRIIRLEDGCVVGRKRRRARLAAAV
jgi:putative ABC transport system ATP-binding protein